MSYMLELHDHIWHGHTEVSCMSMSQETFQLYLATYIHLLNGETTQMQKEAMQHVIKLSYWAYAHYDRNIHFVPLPGCILEERKGRKDG